VSDIFLSIIFFSGIFLIFKIIERKKLHVINIIVVNYFFAAILGNIQSSTNPLNSISEDWFIFALIIGVLFFVFFHVISLSIKLTGISVTTIASKMSVIIPIIFSIIYYNEVLTIFKIIGILLAIIGVILTVYQKKDIDSKQSNPNLLVPLLLFIGMGITDLLFGYSQKEFNIQDPSLFNSTLFYISFITGLAYILISKDIQKIIKKDTLVYGFILGIVNYLGVYYFVKALGSNIFDRSIIFGINNVGIVVVSVLLGIVLFKEKISKINSLGIISSIIAIITLSIS